MSNDRSPAFADVASPDASIVIPVHGKWSLTQQCLRALAVDDARHSFEVIVVDDCSPDDTGRQLAGIPEVITVSTETNVGFLHAANRGAQAARAEVIVFLNNDTIPQAGWLDALLDLLDAHPTIGLAGSLLIGTDGLVQESGGIIWADGSGWNFGRGLPPERPEVRAVRDVDYCSAAALAVRTGIFDELGGFDSRFAPAYYEDTDLCFAVRAAGHRVVVQPDSVVIHVEGGSHGAHGAGGLKRFQEVNRHTFVRKWRNELVGRGLPSDPAATWIARNRRPRGMVLVVDATVPTPDRDSGSRRMTAIVDELLDMGASVHVASASPAVLQPYTADLERKGVTVLVDEDCQQQFFREAGPRLDAVLISRMTIAWHYLELAYQHAPDALVVFDTVDLHSLRAHRQAEIECDRALARHADLLWARESAVIRATDVTLVVAEYEKDVIAELVPEAEVRVLSNIHNPVVTEPRIDGRSGVVFVGGYRHPPNVDAARWLAATIMPLVWQRLPDAALSLVGPELPDELRELDDPRITALGWVADLTPVYASARVVVAPLRYGAGVKGKVGEAIEHGVPIVGTTIAVEGIQLAHGVDVLVADDAFAFADAISRLLTDDDLWNALAGRAQERLEQFSPKRARAVLEELLDPGTRLARRRSPLATVARRGRGGNPRTGADRTPPAAAPRRSPGSSADFRTAQI